MDIMTLEQACEAAAKMENGDKSMFILDKEPEKFQIATLSFKLTNEAKPAGKIFLVKRIGKTLYIRCFNP